MKTRMWCRQFAIVPVLVLAGGLFAPGTARAAMLLTFSDRSSIGGPAPGQLPARVGFLVRDNQLFIAIQNQATNFRINQFNFNADSTLLGLSGGQGITVAGSGTSQTQRADGFGMFNWRIRFADALDPGETRVLALTMTGTTTEWGLGNRLSSIPPGHTRAYGALLFMDGPGGSSGYGATTDPGTSVNAVPEPSALALALAGLAAIGFGVARRFWHGPPGALRTG